MPPRRDPGPVALPSFWFTTRANTKTGAYLDSADEIGIPDGRNPRISSFVIAGLPNVHTVVNIKKALFGNRYKKIDLYLDSGQSSPVNNTTIVNLSRHGLTKANPLLFVDRDNDAEESKEVNDERRQIKYDKFTKRLKNITTGGEFESSCLSPARPPIHSL
jgi:hypothetical protein